MKKTTTNAKTNNCLNIVRLEEFAFTSNPCAGILVPAKNAPTWDPNSFA
jgi:hypothetical protein